MTIFLLSLIGVPLTGGFFGKFYIFKSALDSNLIWLTVLGLLVLGVVMAGAGRWIAYYEPKKEPVVRTVSMLIGAPHADQQR